jgi:hypothetical protein
MEPLDGNAIGGLLFDALGAEATDAACACASCGRTGPVAELVVYMRGPGAVARCRACESVLVVLVEIRGVVCVDLRGLDRLDVAR